MQKRVKKGGGIALGVLNSLEPSWISEGGDEAEAITVEIWVEGFPIRLDCGYGPQENDSKQRKGQFCEYIEKEVQNSTKNGSGLVIQMDGNLWAGDNIVKGDPNKGNQNEKMFEKFLKRLSHLNVVNALKPCEGKITCEKHTSRGTERSILDFFIVCDQILPLVSRMVIDEKGEFALTK